MKPWVMGMACLLSTGGCCEAHQGDQYAKKAIEREIQALKERQHRLRSSEMDEEVEAQGWMIADWEKYGRDVELIRQQQEEDKEINQRIQELEALRAAMEASLPASSTAREA